MHLRRVQLQDFRLFAQARLDCSAGFNLVIGDNGAGKSSLLEALYMLGRGASPRAPARALARDSTAGWAVEGWADPGSGAPPQRVRVAWAGGETRSLWGAAAVGASELVRNLPIQFLDPSMHRLIDEGPGVRRRLIDWGLFHVEQSFLGVWRRHQRALRQRNAALRAGAAQAAVAAWDQELAEAAAALDAMRSAYLQALEPQFLGTLGGLLPEANWRFRYQRGWPAGEEYLAALRGGLERDRRYGQTMPGPQRAELVFAAGEEGGPRARGRISRGQQKLLVCAFALAQCAMVRQAQGAAPILLLDDFAAELSPAFQHGLAAALRDYPGQKFVTALERTAALAGWLEAEAAPAMFHVEHGEVTALVK